MAEQSKKSSRKTQPTTRTRRRSSSSTQGLNISFGGSSFDGISDVAAEARKEIANALQLHRSSNNTSFAAAARANAYASGTGFNTTTAVSNICTGCGSCRCVANCTSCSLIHHHQYCSYSASPMNKFPAAAAAGYSYLWQPLVSQPIWSTTSPSVFPVTPAPFTTAATNYSTGGDVVYNICDEQLQDQDNFNIDWGDKLANSSYTWWFDFLKSLDGGGGGGGCTNGVLVSNNDAANQFFKQQQQELHMEDQNFPSSLEHHDWLIEPGSNN